MKQKLIFSLSIILLLTACKKPGNDRLAGVNDELKQKVIHFLEGKMKTAGDSTKQFIKDLQNNINWTDVYITTASLGGRQIFYSLSSSFKTESNIGLRNNSLLLSENINGTIRSASVLSVTLPADGKPVTNGLMSDLINDKKPHYTGTFTKMGLNKRLSYEIGFADGKAVTCKSAIARPSVQGPQLTGCIDWYWMYYSNGVLIYEEYAYTTCDGGDGECEYKMINGTMHRVNCTGGGGGGNGGIDTIINPCAHANSLKNDSSFRSQMQLLKSIAIDPAVNFENGYVKGKDANGNVVYQPVQGNPGQPYLPNFAFNVPIDGMMHTHFMGGFSIFSPSDLRALYNTYKDGMANQGFTFAVITPTGNYVLQVTDINAFLQYGASHFEDTVLYNVFQAGTYAQFGISEIGSQAGNEAGFLNMIKSQGMGLTLMSGSNDFQNWDVKDVQNNIPITVNCG